MSLHLVVEVVLLNAIFGIVFDTLGHLRDGKLVFFVTYPVRLALYH
jgi:hypothetical protein